MPSTSSKKEPALTAERLRELLDYDPITGIFRWRADRWRARAGDIAGCILKTGYVSIKIEQGVYAGHRLAWLHVHGEWPAGDLDHEDTIKSHNWIDNLRPASNSQNQANRRRSAQNTSGYKGVSYFRRTGRWTAELKVNGKKVFRGYFNTAEEAHAAYVAAANRYFGRFANAG